VTCSLSANLVFDVTCHFAPTPIGSVGTTALEALRAGDLFGISLIVIDGRVVVGRSRNTPPAARAAGVVKGHGPAAGGH